jgi:hypothetical protein
MATTTAALTFTTTPNGHDVRIECDRCHASKAGSLARAWAGSHDCRPREVVFVELVPATGYWIGVANHACADPEYIHVPAHFRDNVTTADYCPGFDGPDRRMWDDLCSRCQAADEKIPF